MRTTLLAGLCAASSALGQVPSTTPTASPTVQDVQAAARIAGTGFSLVHFDRPTADGPLWAVGSAWKASFDATGSTVHPFFGATAPRNFPLRLELANATVGGERLALEPGTPTTAGTEVRTHRGALTEVIATGLDRLEQSFVFDALPNRGAIAVDVRIATELQATPIDGGLRFANEFGHVDYTHAIAVDGAGARLALPIVWTGEAVHLEIPAEFVAKAQLPIVIDPLLMYWYNLGSGIPQSQHDCDVASYLAFPANNGRVAFVWLRQFSATDTDCWGLVFDSNLGLVQSDFPIDATIEDWRRVSIAANGYAQNFLVVAEAHYGPSGYIVGRTLTGAGVLGTEFNIERDGFGGLPGDSLHPDVGGDPYYGVGRYTVVFQKANGSTFDIYARQVSPAGILVGAGPTAIDTSSTTESNPAISKSCGPSNGLPAYWLLTWQRTYPASPYDQEIYGRYVNWNGAVLGTAPFPIAITVNEESSPAPGSPFDVNGVRYWPIAYESAPSLGQYRDVVCKVLRSDGAMWVSTVVDAVSFTDDRAPSVDSDGTRFVVTRTKSVLGSARTIEATTYAYLPSQNVLRVEERSALGTDISVDEFDQTNVCAANSGSQGFSATYFAGFTDPTNNTLRLAMYGGWSGAAGFTTRSTQCGTQANITASGTPTLGATLSITSTAPFFSGILLGFPGNSPIAGCGCTLGVAFPQSMPNPLTWYVPTNPDFVGLQLSAQAFTFSGTTCFGAIDVSDTVDFTIR